MAANTADAKKQDEYFKSNISNMIALANAKTCPRFSVFLDERQQAMANEVLTHCRAEHFCFFGGCDGCERVVLGVFPPEIEVSADFFPIRALRISHSERVSLTHRDYLGALMSLQLKREAVGDIAVSDGGAIVFLSEDVADCVRFELRQIGRTSVTVEETECGQVEKKQEYQEMTGTVSSLRLDCVTAFLMNKSRSIAVQAIESGIVRVNGLETANVSGQVSPGDKISIRGIGKFLLDEEMKRTKKDRIFIRANKLL